MKKCLFCSNYIPLNKKNNKFCNNKCHTNFQKNIVRTKIEKTGNIDGHSSGRRYLLETRGNKCEICGLKEWNNNFIIMIVDHIDGNSSNNMVSNLRLVCPNCDSQLPTYKGRNKGNGRHNRRKRYSEGKSY